MKTKYNVNQIVNSI